MKSKCINCSKNINDTCEIYRLALEEVVCECAYYEVYVGSLSVGDRIGYDMEVVERDEESQTN